MRHNYALAFPLTALPLDLPYSPFYAAVSLGNCDFSNRSTR